MDRLTDPQSLRAVSQKVLCELLSISTTTCNKLAREGVLKKHGRGCYDAIDSIQAFIQHQIASTEGQNERSNLVAQQTRKLLLQNLVADGELIPIDEASYVMTQYATALRAGLMSLPSRVAHHLSGISKPALIRAVLLKEIDEFLEACEEFFQGLDTSPDSAPPGRHSQPTTFAL